MTLTEPKDLADVKDMVRIPAGHWELGTDDPVLPADGEGPARIKSLSSFLIDRFEVSRADFEEFAKESGYVTDVS